MADKKNTPAPTLLIYFVVLLWAVDTRPERPENHKDVETPDGGWRTKSGEKKVGTGVRVDTDDGAEAMEKALEMLRALPAGSGQRVARIEIKREEEAASEDGTASPFAGLAQ